jgi:hypothetical protein
VTLTISRLAGLAVIMLVNLPNSCVARAEASQILSLLSWAGGSIEPMSAIELDTLYQPLSIEGTPFALGLHHKQRRPLLRLSVNHFVFEVVMNYTITPFEGVGPIKLGMTPEEVETILGEPESAGEHDGASEFANGLYAYGSLGISVLFQKRKAREIWLFLADCNPEFKSRGLGGRTCRDVYEWFRSLGTPIQHDLCGMIFLRFGIYLYCHNFDPVEGMDDPVEMLSILGQETVDLYIEEGNDPYPLEVGILV